MTYPIKDLSKWNLAKKAASCPTPHEARAVLGLSVEQFCKLIEISRQTYWRWVTGESEPSMAEKMLIKKCIEIDINEKYFNKGLKESHLEIFKLRYGIENYKPHKFREIAEIYGLSNSRIQQIVHKIIKCLVHPGRKNHPLREQAVKIWEELMAKIEKKEILNG